MSTAAGLRSDDRAALAELAPVLRRAVDLDAKALVRLRLGPDVATALVRLPFGVLISRSVRLDTAAQPRDGIVRDVATRADETLAWLDAPSDSTDPTDPNGPPAPRRRDADWRYGLPPTSGWQRVETVPDDVVRPLVRSGAAALKDAAAREGVPGAKPRSEVADALLDAVVLTVSDDDAGASAEISLRALSALTRMGFLARESTMHVDVAGRWIRIVGSYGTVYLERPGAGLGMLSG